MKEIAKEYQVEWDTTESEMELLKPPEELTMSSSLSLPAPSCVKIKFYYPVLILTLFDQEGPKTFVSATSIPIKPMPKKSVEPTNPSTTRYSDIGERNSMNFEDTSSVVEAATESAKKAIAAAGTAAYLANRDSYQFVPLCLGFTYKCLICIRGCWFWEYWIFLDYCFSRRTHFLSYFGKRYITSGIICGSARFSNLWRKVILHA